MEQKSIIDLIYNHFKNEYSYSEPVLLKDIYTAFPNIKTGTIRESLRRLVVEEKLFKLQAGIFGLPDPQRILPTPLINVDEAINKLYIQTQQGEIIGYRSGFFFANALGLTTQVPSTITIFSNAVAPKKRTIKIKNVSITINRSRTKVTAGNYKLLQILDLLSSFNIYSEYPLSIARDKLFTYLGNLSLPKTEIETIVALYPKDAQINFYKIGGVDALTH